jgi:hypothetical protein
LFKRHPKMRKMVVDQGISTVASVMLMRITLARMTGVSPIEGCSHKARRKSRRCILLHNIHEPIVWIYHFWLLPVGFRQILEPSDR